MLIAPPGSRDRLNLAQKSLRTVQVWTYATGFTFILLVMFANPGHRLAVATLELFVAHFHLIIH